VIRLLLIIQMSDPSNKRMMALFLGPFNRVSLCFVRSKHVLSVVFYDIIVN